MTAEDAITGPLSGLRILELGHFIAAPFATRVLADLGADVIKVEPPGRGDPVRTWGEHVDGRTLWWPVHGRNKKSVTVDLRQPQGAELVKRLIGHVDAVVENFKPGQLEKWGIGPAEIEAAHPGTIVVRVSGYGQTGPYRNRAAFGVIGEAVGGIRYLTGYPAAESELPPVRTGVSFGDSVTGLYAAIGLLAALFEKQQRKLAGNGDAPGRVVDAALTESVLSLLEGCLPEYGHLGSVREPQGSVIRTAAPSNAYPTKDGRWFLIGGNSDALFARLCRCMGRTDLLDDPRFQDNPGRVEHMKELDAEIAAWTRTLTVGELEAKLQEADVPSTRIYNVADIAADPQFRDRGMVREEPDPRFGKVLHPGVVPRFAGEAAGGVRWPGPEIGAHTDEVLADMLGMTEDEITKLRQEKVI